MVSSLRSGVIRVGIALVLGILVSGCANISTPIPTPLTIGTYVIDGASFIFTGKSATDHAISAVMEQDCSVTRAFRGRYVCHEEGDNSDEERYQLLAAIHGEYSPHTSPFEIVAIDSAESVGENDGVSAPPDEPPTAIVRTHKPDRSIATAFTLRTNSWDARPPD